MLPGEAGLLREDASSAIPVDPCPGRSLAADHEHVDPLHAPLPGASAGPRAAARRSLPWSLPMSLPDERRRSLPRDIRSRLRTGPPLSIEEIHRQGARPAAVLVPILLAGP